jgi:hypothetical protein
VKDTEAKATERYMHGGFGKLGSKAAYKRYAAYVDLLNGKKKIDPREWIGYIFVPTHAPKGGDGE